MIGRLQRLLLFWAVVTLTAVFLGQRLFHRPDQVQTTLFLIGAAALLGSLVARLEVGTLTLSAIPLFAAAALLSPLEAAIVGVAGNLTRTVQTRHRTVIPLAFAYSVWTSTAAFVAGAMREVASEDIGATTGVGVALVLNLVTSTLTVAAWNDRSVRGVIRSINWPTLVNAYSQFILSALCLYLIISRYHDYVLAAAVAALSVFVAYGSSRTELETVLRNELLGASVRLRYLEQVKEDLHRLKNYVSSALLWIDTSTGPRPTDEALETVRDSLASASELLIRLGDEAAASVSDRQVNDLIVLAREAMVLAQPAARSATVSLVDRLGEGPMTLTCQRMEIRDAINNLLLNAIHASRPGQSIVMSAMTGPKWHSVSVRDWAGGVPEELLPGLFTHRKPGTLGHGIGLLSAQQAAYGHGGSIMHQARRKGSEFILRLPVQDRSAKL